MFNVYLCYTLQPTKASPREKAAQAHNPPPVGPCLLHPALSLPELGAGCWQSHTGRMLYLAQTEVMMPVCEHTAMSNPTPLVLTACSVLTVLPAITKFHLSVAFLSNLAPSWLQNSVTLWLLFNLADGCHPFQYY